MLISMHIENIAVIRRLDVDLIEVLPFSPAKPARVSL